ncbi:784_t:CDS:2, partial [Gigaspora margarita]
KPSIRNLIDVHGQRKYLLGVVESLLIVIIKIEISINVEVMEAKDYTMIVGTDWLDKNEKYQTPITCWKKMIYNLGKPVPLEKRNREEKDKKEDEEEYEPEEVEEEKSYVVQEDEDKLPIVEIKKKTMNIEGKEEPGIVCWCKKRLNSEEESCIKCKELFKGIETLKCLVDNLDKELGISHRTKEYTNLDKNQQAKVEELMENNKFLFAEGLTQLKRTKKKYIQLY